MDDFVIKANPSNLKTLPLVSMIVRVSRLSKSFKSRKILVGLIYRGVLSPLDPSVLPVDSLQCTACIFSKTACIFEIANGHEQSQISKHNKKEIIEVTRVLGAAAGCLKRSVFVTGVGEP
jgi:hypothetical protein